MVETLVTGLPALAPELRLHHVNPRLSRNAGDIGRWRPGKLLALLRACAAAVWLRLRHGAMPLYYIPAPGRRGALYRDWLVMLLCRPFFSQLVLHWHAVGLGEWLQTSALAPERWLTQWLLGRADLAIVLATELAEDAGYFAPRRTVVVTNGIDVPASPGAARATAAPSPSPALPSASGSEEPRHPTRVLFVGACTAEKGLFDLLTAVAIANRREPGAFHLTVAGAFANDSEATAFRSQVAAIGPGVVRHAGFVNANELSGLLADASIFCFPTAYAAEGQPLVLIEALAADLPIITTHWRAIPSMLPRDHVAYVEPHRPDQIAAALRATAGAPLPAGRLRHHYEQHFTRTRHLAALAAALRSV